MENKKWLLPLGIGVLLINFILTIILVAVTIPAITKINKIVSTVENEISASGVGKENTKEIPIQQQETIQYDDQETVSIRSSEGQIHVVRYKISIVIDKKNKESKSLKTVLNDKKVLVQNMVREVIENKSFDDISKVGGKNNLESEITEVLKNKLNTSAIINIILNGFIYQ